MTEKEKDKEKEQQKDSHLPRTILANATKSPMIYIKTFIREAEDALKASIIHAPGIPPILPVKLPDPALFNDPNLLADARDSQSLSLLAANIQDTIKVVKTSSLKCLNPHNILQLREKMPINYIAQTKTQDAVPNLSLDLSLNGPSVQPETPASTRNPPHAILVVDFCSAPKITARQQQFQFHTAQPLTALRDAFYCIGDFLTYGQESINQQVNSKTTKLSSSYFLIENTFYNDMRSPEAIDYSKPILQWLQDENRFLHSNLGLFQSKKMNETLLEDLHLQLNKPYLFVHQGNCSHFIIFRELR
jgi:hypothetical protein